MEQLGDLKAKANTRSGCKSNNANCMARSYQHAIMAAVLCA
jgi:hypothetical protein